MESWNKYYDNKISWEIFLNKLADHSFYLEKIIELNPKKTLEVGCGPGTRSIFLSHLGVKAVAIDIDEGIVSQVKNYNTKFKGSVQVDKLDAFNLPYKDKEFDVVFNAGFLEHFDDDDKIKLVKEFTRVAKYYIFMVPNKNYRLRPYGNEDLLTKNQWEKILNPFKINESLNIYKSWSNSFVRKIIEVIAFTFGFDIRQNLMYYAKISSID
jgi:SAM-dependent methyltransferase